LVVSVSRAGLISIRAFLLEKLDARFGLGETCEDRNIAG
jgi:hypothetical protein